MYVINSVGLYCILFVKIIFIRDKRKKKYFIDKSNFRSCYNMFF